jgi:hypothetical protein
MTNWIDYFLKMYIIQMEAKCVSAKSIACVGPEEKKK